MRLAKRSHVFAEHDDFMSATSTVCVKSMDVATSYSLDDVSAESGTISANAIGMRILIGKSRNPGRFLTVFALIILGLTRPAVHAITIQAASASYADVSSAVASASSLDTVLVPAGTATWTDSLTITKGINLIGAGIDATVIQYAGKGGTSAFAVKVTPDADTAQNDYPVRISGFTWIQLVNVYATLYLGNDYLTNALTEVVIDHNKFIQHTYSGIYLGLAMFGVTHNNIFLDGGPWRFLGPGIASGKLVNCWRPGAADAMYFEDNYIALLNSNTISGPGGGQGNRYVGRYNTWDYSKIDPYDRLASPFDFHGNQPGNGGGGIGMEIYGNLRIGTRSRWVDQRGGQTMFFCNRWITGNGGAGSYYIWEEYNDDVFESTSAEGTYYPRTTLGNVLQSIHDSYYWQNFGGSSGDVLTTSCVVAFDHYQRSGSLLEEIVNDPPTICENQDFWRDNASPFDGSVAPIGSCGVYAGPSCTKSGIGYGTLAEMLAITPTSKGLGFWVSDHPLDIVAMTGQHPKTPINGTFYRAVENGSGGYEWKAYYIPLAYPHPLRGEGTSVVSPHSFSATDGQISAPFTCDVNGYLLQSISTTNALDGGRASYAFSTAVPGDYMVQATVIAQNMASNSFFVDIDAEPIAEDSVWDIPCGLGLQNRYVTSSDSVQSPRAWSLKAGVHELIVRGREADTRLQQIRVFTADSSRPAPISNAH